MIEVNVSDDAEVDLVVNAEHYESKETGLGLFFQSTILADLSSLELTGGSHALKYGFHRKICKTFPYWIYYRIESNNSLTVMAIVGQRRGDEYLKARLGGG